MIVQSNLELFNVLSTSFILIKHFILQKPNLILNVDGFVAVSMVDFLRNSGLFTRSVLFVANHTCTHIKLLVPRGVRVPGIFTLSLLMLVHRPSACICIHYIKFCEDKTTMYFLNVLVRVGVLGNNSCILLSVRKFKWDSLTSHKRLFNSECCRKHSTLFPS